MHWPRVRPLPPAPDPRLVTRRAMREDAVGDPLSLLLPGTVDTAAGTRAEATRVARTVAVASLGERHPWQDLQPRSRAELSTMMRHGFPALAAQNMRDMKWKRFLYKQLCEREALCVCKAPSCTPCDDLALCFGPEV